MLELLEPRRLLAAAFGADGVLRITGTDGPDRISVEHALRQRINVFVNGERVMQLHLAALKQIAIAGGAGSDKIFVDYLFGYTIPSTLAGGGGNDNIISASYFSQMSGGNGRDYLSGGEVIHGGANADTLIGDNLADTLFGDGGNDHLVGWTGSDEIWGGPGIDTVSYEDHADSSVDRVTVTLDGVANDGYFEHPQIDLPGGSRGGQVDTTHERDNIEPDVENVVGTNWNDSLTGDGGANLLIGGAGADTLTGGGGADASDHDPLDVRVGIETP